MIEVLFVCLGNICRSPTAHGVFAEKVSARGLAGNIRVDSAGTSGWHIGEPPDPRSSQAAALRGYDLSGQRGRQVSASDFDRFHYILAMDKSNLANLRRLVPARFSGTLDLFLPFANDLPAEVPDPYYGGGDGFERVLDLVEVASDALLDHLIATHSLKKVRS